MPALSSNSTPEALRTFIASPKKLLINGQWVNAQSEKTFDVFDPATDKVVAAVDVQQAAQIASRNYLCRVEPMSALHRLQVSVKVRPNRRRL